MEMLSGAEMVVRSLIDQGVKQVFGYPGGAVLDIYDALHTVGGIDHVLVRHRLYGFHSISCPFRAGSDLVDRLRCLSGVRHGGDFATGG